MSLIVYHLNAADEFVEVNEGWVRFARENGGEAFLPEFILGRKIWDFITNDPTVQLYRLIFERVRRGKTFQFSFRCDAPATRRLLEMTLRPGKAGGIELQTTPLWVQERAPQQLVANAQLPRPEKFLLMCGWCKRISVGKDEWEEVEDAIGRLDLFSHEDTTQVTHGICQQCYDRVFENLRQA